nr:hypothetical protein [Candidatus Sigynarchaeota archaeon]
MAAVESNLGASERLALQKLKDEYQRANGCELLQLEHLALGNRSGFSIKDDHVDVINLQIDRPPLFVHNRNKKFEDLQKINNSHESRPARYLRWALHRATARFGRFPRLAGGASTCRFSTVILSPGYI